jgi:hypothetical protein
VGIGQDKKKFDPSTAKVFDPSTAQPLDVSNAVPTEPQKPMSFIDMMSSAGQNLLPSAAKMGGDIWNAVTNPVETVKGAGNILAGVIKTGATGQLSPELHPLVQFYADRYGGLDNLKNTVANDPTGFLADISTFLTGAGGATKSGVLKTAAKVADPIAAPGNLFRQAARAIPEKIPVRIYESAIKPSTTLSDAERSRIALTGLREGIAPTRGGLNKIRSTVDELNNQISGQIASGAQAGETVNAYDVAKRLQSPADFYGNTVNPNKPIADIKAAGDEFIAAHGPEIPIDKAQKIKQNTYVANRKRYGELSSASNEAQKNLARGIKEEIVAKHPELSALNAREGSLLELDDAIQSAVNRIYNKELFPTSSIWTGLAAGSVTGNVGAGIETFIARAALENATVKSKLAIALNNARKGGIKGGEVPIIGVLARPTNQ